jgi:hypothetical protein
MPTQPPATSTPTASSSDSTLTMLPASASVDDNSPSAPPSANHYDDDDDDEDPPVAHPSIKDEEDDGKPGRHPDWHLLIRNELVARVPKYIMHQEQGVRKGKKLNAQLNEEITDIIGNICNYRQKYLFAKLQPNEHAKPVVNNFLPILCLPLKDIPESKRDATEQRRIAFRSTVRGVSHLLSALALPTADGTYGSLFRHAWEPSPERLRSALRMLTSSRSSNRSTS